MTHSSVKAGGMFDKLQSQSVISLIKTAFNTLVEILFARDDRTRTQREALLAFSVRVGSAGLLYLSQVILARWMGSTEYGIYVFVWTWVVVLGAIADLGFNTSNIRFTAEYRERKEFGYLHGVIFTSRLIAVGVGTLFMLIGILGLWLFETPTKPYVLPGYLALICLPLYALTFIQDGIGRGLNWMSAALIPTFILRPLAILLLMYAAYILGFEMKATTAAGAAIIATYITSLFQIFLIDRNVKREIPREPKKYNLQKWFAISMPLLLIHACEIALQNGDILIVSRYMEPEAVGIYYAAAKTMSLIMFVHYAVGSAVATRFSALNARGDEDALRALVKDAVNWIFWPSLASAAIILALGPFLLSLFGEGFTSGYSVMVILVVGFMLRSAVGPTEYLLNMLGEQKSCAISLVITAVLNIALNFLLVPIYGLDGAAIATSISLCFAALVQYIIIRKRLNIDMGIWSHIPRRTKS